MQHRMKSATSLRVHVKYVMAPGASRPLFDPRRRSFPPSEFYESTGRPALSYPRTALSARQIG